VSDPTRIEENDVVDIMFTHWTLHRATVRYLPQATGDSWRLIAEDGSVWYVQNFEAMHVVAK
jgi:hypothetical protein